MSIYVRESDFIQNVLSRIAIAHLVTMSGKFGAEDGLWLDDQMNQGTFTVTLAVGHSADLFIGEKGRSVENCEPLFSCKQYTAQISIVCGVIHQICADLTGE